MPVLDKSRVLEALKNELESELTTAIAAQRQTQQGATHEESKPENDKDTRALEATYLARGQAQRVIDLETALARVNALPPRDFSGKPAALGALVQIDDDDNMHWYLLAPGGGGLKLDVESVALTVVTPESPVGRALLGRRTGDDVDIRTPQGVRECSIVEVL